MKRRKGFRRALLSTLAGGGLLFAAASWLVARKISGRLISAVGLGPPPQDRQDLLEALKSNARIVSDDRHPGSARSPVELAAVLASPGDVALRPTILFLHGKGGNAIEWKRDAVRALRLGYNVLLPDLRGHGSSQGDFVTYGLLEKEDLANAIEAARERHGVDPDRLGLHSCSAGSAVALELAADRPGVQALWLESPYADPRRMARHYLSLATGIPEFLLGLTSLLAVRRAVAHVARQLGASESTGLAHVDSLRTVAAIRAPILLVYGASDRLVPERFVERLARALPAGSEIWRTPAGHCHHEDEPAKVLAAEYEERWTVFFARHLPIAEIRT